MKHFLKALFWCLIDIAIIMYLQLSDLGSTLKMWLKKDKPYLLYIAFTALLVVGVIYIYLINQL